MTAIIHPRELGVTLRCNYPGCAATHTTALISVRHNRKAAAGGGWIRGLLKRSTGSAKTGTGELANARWDVCPAHAVEERAKAEARKTAANERRAARDAKRRALDEKLRAS